MPPSIEDQLRVLESTVHELETDSIDLETAMTKYSQSVQQLSGILSQLNDAEKKLYRLKEAAEKLFEEPVDPS